MSSQSPGIGSALPDMNANTSAMVLTNDGVAASWEDAASAGLPPQTGNSGKLLTTNGTAASWAAVTADSLLPSQSAKSGYFLSTNGTTVSWSLSLTALLPAQSTHSGQFLTTDGAGVLSWAVVTGAGVDTMAAVGSAPTANAASIAGTTLTMQPADLTHPGVVTEGNQTFGGDKTISGVALKALGTLGTDPGIQFDANYFAIGATNSGHQGYIIFYADGGASFSIYNDSEKMCTFSGTGAGNTSLMDLDGAGAGAKTHLKMTKTDTTGTPGDAAAVTPCGKSSIDTGATACVITDARVAATDIILITPLDINATATVLKAVPGTGSFTVTANAAATSAPLQFSWLVIKTG